MYRKSLCLLLACAAILCLAVAARAETEDGKAKIVPWSGYWWPHFEGRLLEPLGKYDEYVGSDAAATWENKHHPKAGAAHWEGYCHAWSAASVLEGEPAASLEVRLSGGKSLSLTVGDQKGLLTASHARDVANIIGNRHYGPGYDPNHLAADVLWKTLKLYIKQQGVPLILDVDPGDQVWNYPAYAYHVDYANGNDGLYHCHMTLWLADDIVPPSFLGTKVSKRDYQFTCKMRNGSVVMGSSKWIGSSVSDHPDFAWYPYVIRPENPNVDYAKVRQMLNLPPRTPTETTALPVNPVTDPDNPPQPPGAPPPPPAIAGAPPAQSIPVALSPTELLTFLVHSDKKASAFHLDVQMDQGLKAIYKPGERYFVRGESDKAGYIYLFHLDPEGDAELIYPMPGQDNRVPAKKHFEIGSPKDDAKFVCGDMVGYHRIKAIVTTRPLTLTGTDQTGAQQQQQTTQQQGQSMKFAINPSLQADLRKAITDVQAEKRSAKQIEVETGVDLHKALPEFAYDEETFVIRAEEKKPAPKPGEKTLPSETKP